MTIEELRISKAFVVRASGLPTNTQAGRLHHTSSKRPNWGRIGEVSRMGARQTGLAARIEPEEGTQTVRLLGYEAFSFST